MGKLIETKKSLADRGAMNRILVIDGEAFSELNRIRLCARIIPSDALFWLMVTQKEYVMLSPPPIVSLAHHAGRLEQCVVTPVIEKPDRPREPGRLGAWVESINILLSRNGFSIVRVPSAEENQSRQLYEYLRAELPKEVRLSIDTLVCEGALICS